MNFLDATNSGDGWWNVAGTQFKGPNNANPRMQFAIRPEDIRIGQGAIETKIRLLEPLGSHILAACQVDGQLFRVVLESDMPVSVGDTIQLEPMADRVRWFDPDTQLAAH